MTDSVQNTDFPGGSKKLRKGNVGGEPEQPMLFAFLIGQASHIITQGTEKMVFTSPLSDKGKNFISVKEGKSLFVKDQNGEFSIDGNTTGQRGFFNINLENNIQSAGNDKVKKTNQLLSGKINLLPERGGQKQTLGEVKNFPKEILSKEAVPGSLKSGSLNPGLKNPGIESGSLKSVLTSAVVGNDAAVKKNSRTIPQEGSGKNSIENLLKNPGLKGKEIIVEHGKTGVKELTGHKMEILPKEILSKEAVPGSLKSGSLNPGLKNPGIESGSLKSVLTSAVVGNDAAVKKNSRTIPQEGSGKNSIENLLKNPGLKGKEIIVEHGKTGVKELTGHKMEILPKEILSPKHLVDKIPSMGGYHHTAIHAGSSTAAVNESVNNYSMEPRNLINQIANSLTRPGRVRIALTPPHLGTLDMDVLVRNNKVHIILQTENNDVRHMLQSNVDTLKTALRSQGLIADNINVFVQERSDSAGYSGFGRNETQFKENNNQKENEEDHRGRSDSLNYTPSPFDKENPRVMIDGGISLFA